MFRKKELIIIGDRPGEILEHIKKINTSADIQTDIRAIHEVTQQELSSVPKVQILLEDPSHIAFQDTKENIQVCFRENIVTTIPRLKPIIIYTASLLTNEQTSTLEQMPVFVQYMNKYTLVAKFYENLMSRIIYGVREHPFGEEMNDAFIKGHRGIVTKEKDDILTFRGENLSAMLMNNHFSNNHFVLMDYALQILPIFLTGHKDAHKEEIKKDIQKIENTRKHYFKDAFPTPLLSTKIEEIQKIADTFLTVEKAAKIKNKVDQGYILLKLVNETLYKIYANFPVSFIHEEIAFSSFVEIFIGLNKEFDGIFGEILEYLYSSSDLTFAASPYQIEIITAALKIMYPFYTEHAKNKKANNIALLENNTLRLSLHTPLLAYDHSQSLLPLIQELNRVYENHKSKENTTCVEMRTKEGYFEIDISSCESTEK